MHLKIVVAAIASVLMIASAHAQDGARAYFPVPAGTNDIEGTLTVSHMEIPAGVFDSPVFTPSYRHTFDVMGDAVTFLIGLPVGKVSATLNTPFGPFPQETNPAQGDLFVGGTVGLVGAPALAPMDYATFQPGLAVSFATKLFLPTGNYDSSRFVNLGQNRWSFQASLPIMYVLGGSLVDPQVTTFELVPSVQIFGDNKDAPGPATVGSQAPLYGVEAHVTHSFNPMVWAAVDGFAAFGGETSFDGIAQKDGQQSLSLGATLGLTLSRSVALRLNYQEQVYSNVPKSVNRRFMGTAAFLF